MAIFMAMTKSISRGRGQSAVASASYRAGEKLQDARYGKVQDYSKKEGVLSKEIIFPSALILLSVYGLKFGLSDITIIDKFLSINVIFSSRISGKNPPEKPQLLRLSIILD